MPVERDNREDVDEPRSAGGVQSLGRAFELLEAMADSGGIVGLTELAQRSGMAMPTIHRLIRTMVDLGYVRQGPSRKYALGPRLVRLGESATQVLGIWAQPALRHLVTELGESANLAVLDGSEVIYVAQAPGRHAMRMFTEVGRRADVHSTAVGKAILAQLDEQVVDEILRGAGMAKRTENTITRPSALKRELKTVHRKGFAIDEEEQEVGVRCVAVALPGHAMRAGISISGPLGRMNDELVRRAVPLLEQTAAELVGDFDRSLAAGARPSPAVERVDPVAHRRSGGA
jgi:IclR family acetate operon transcriptional repressor